MQKIRQEKERKVQNTAEMHQSAASVPEAGSIFAVGACEYRRLPYCAPYGIYTRPAQGEDLMILSAQSGEVCLGVVSQPQEELLPGEILLKSSVEQVFDCATTGQFC